MSTHHLESLYRHSSSSLRTMVMAARNTDTSALLFVCGPTTGSLTFGYSPCGKYTPYPVCPRTSDPSTHGCILVVSSKKSGTDSRSDMLNKSRSGDPSCCGRSPSRPSRSSSVVAMCAHAGDHGLSALRGRLLSSSDIGCYSPVGDIGSSPGPSSAYPSPSGGSAIGSICTTGHPGAMSDDAHCCGSSSTWTHASRCACCLSLLRIRAFSFRCALDRRSCASCCPIMETLTCIARWRALSTLGSSPSMRCQCCQNHIDSFSDVDAASCCSVLQNHTLVSVKVTSSAMTTVKAPTSILRTAA